MGLIQNHEIRGQVFPMVHGVVELVSKNFGSSDNDRSIRILFSIPGENAHRIFAEVR